MKYAGLLRENPVYVRGPRKGTRQCALRMTVTRLTAPPPVVTPCDCSGSGPACTVPLATPSRRDASSTPTRGSAASRSISRASSSSIITSSLPRAACCPVVWAYRGLCYTNCLYILPTVAHLDLLDRCCH